MQGENEKSCEMEMLQKFSDLTLDVIGVCAFGYDFDGILGEISEEGKATNTILTANFNVVRKVLEDIFPLLKLIPSKERNELRKAEDIFYGLINKVFGHCVKFRPCHDFMRGITLLLKSLHMDFQIKLRNKEKNCMVQQS